MSAESPTQGADGPMTILITSDGSSIPETLEVADILIKNEVNKIPTAWITLLDGDTAEQTFPVSDHSAFEPGKEIKIKAGYSSKNKEVFAGIVIRHSLSLTETGRPELKVECKDKAIKATIGRKNGYFEKSKDSDIIKKMITNNSLSADVEATTYKHENVVQYYCSDWDFALSRAELNGLIVITKGGKVTVKAPDLSSSPVLSVTFGADMLQFDADLDAEHQYAKVNGAAWDLGTQKNVTGKGKTPSVNKQGNLDSKKLSKVIGLSELNLQSSAGVSKDMLTAWASSELLRSWMSKIRGTVSFQGSSLAETGKTIELKGLSERFNGTAYISSVEHKLQNGDWKTTVGIGTEHKWFQIQGDVVAPDASGLLPGVKGLMTGKVKQLDKDPENEFRLLVTLPLMQDDAKGVWCRLSNFYATNGKGLFFIPEIGDEVVVGFLNNDPRFPIILGSMYSSKNKMPETPDKKNEVKSITTNSECKISFDDKDKVITIETPGGNSATLTDKDKGIKLEDQNKNSIVLDDSGITIKDKSGNKIVLSSGGIEMKSASNLKGEAATNMELKAGANLKAEATANMEMKGLQITQTANTTFKASGNASAELSAAGQTTIKGAMVMIN